MSYTRYIVYKNVLYTLYKIHCFSGLQYCQNSVSCGAWKDWSQPVSGGASPFAPGIATSMQLSHSYLSETTFAIVVSDEETATGLSSASPHVVLS